MMNKKIRLILWFVILGITFISFVKYGYDLGTNDYKRNRNIENLYSIYRDAGISHESAIVAAEKEAFKSSILIFIGFHLSMFLLINLAFASILGIKVKEKNIPVWTLLFVFLTNGYICMVWASIPWKEVSLSHVALGALLFWFVIGVIFASVIGLGKIISIKMGKGDSSSK